MPMRVGVIDDACTSIHTIQTVVQCITCAVHSEWCTHYTILHGLVLYTIAIEHTGTIYCITCIMHRECSIQLCVEAHSAHMPTEKSGCL